MNYGAEPADQVVRYSLEGMEYSLKITGNVAKHVAIFIAAALKDQKKTRGKTRLTRMLKEQRPMKFFTVPGDRLKEFAKEAKARGILYVVIKDKVNPDQTEVMVFADDAAKMNRVLDRMNLDFVKAESGSMVTEAVEKETAPEKAENQMEKETGENVRTETVVLPEGKIEFELDDAEEMFQIGDEAFPEGNFTHAQEGKAKNPSEPFSRNKNISSGRETSWEEKNEKPSVRKELGDIRKEQEEKALKEDKVEIPAVHMAKKDAGLWKGRVEEIKDPYGWGSSTVAGILKKREYLGHTVNFKTRKHFKDKKSHYVSEDNWTVFENTQEAIIDQETFDNVQRIRSNVRRYPDGWGEAHPLTGLMYCADCGSKMYVHRVNNGKRVPQYTCSAYSKVPVGTLCQTQHRINADVVMELIKELLKAVAEYSQLNREEFLETVKKAQTSQQSSEITRLKSRLAEAKKRVQELEKLICRIYEDNILGKLPDERYTILDGQYSKEQKDLSAEIADMEAELSGYEEGRRSAEKFIALVDKYQNFEELTTYMLNEFVEKIVVHERDRKGSIETTQEVEIYFNFIGKYLPPHFGEVEMTPEEIEEMKKREARKDRLHQNYLKRKANGKQQEYYERTKAKKKAEMDAKKEEIRQEDIAKGVFVPVSLLPPAEPKKGVASA